MPFTWRAERPARRAARGTIEGRLLGQPPTSHARTPSMRTSARRWARSEPGRLARSSSLAERFAEEIALSTNPEPRIVVRRFDLIFLLEDGTVTDRGTHAELMALRRRILRDGATADGFQRPGRRGGVEGGRL